MTGTAPLLKVPGNMDTMTRLSPAKINVTLRVTGIRADGFHELESLVALIGLCDTISVKGRDDERIVVTCDVPGIPTDESNLVWRAADALARASGVRRGVELHIAKRIPAGAGLGGGSSNAATTLMLLNEGWGLGLADDELARIGADVGSDVPLFFHGPVCVMRGRGELVERVGRELRAWVALALPEVHCSTPAIYRAWDRMSEHPRRAAIDDVLASLGSPVELMAASFNDLEEPAFETAAVLRALARDVASLTGCGVRLTGSGAALYRLFADEGEAKGFAEQVTERLGVRTAVVDVLGR